MPLQQVSRCPYCVVGDAFRLLVEGPGGIYSCTNCGHTVLASDPTFECVCHKCSLLRRTSMAVRKAGATRLQK